MITSYRPKFSEWFSVVNLFSSFIGRIEHGAFHHFHLSYRSAKCWKQLEWLVKHQLKCALVTSACKKGPSDRMIAFSNNKCHEIHFTKLYARYSEKSPETTDNYQWMPLYHPTKTKNTSEYPSSSRAKVFLASNTGVWEFQNQIVVQFAIAILLRLP